MNVAEDPYGTPVVYETSSRIAGYVHSDMQVKIDGSAAVIAQKVEKGAVIAFADNPNFRAFWFGTNRLFLNAIFFADTIVKTGDASKAARVPTSGTHVH